MREAMHPEKGQGQHGLGSREQLRARHFRGCGDSWLVSCQARSIMGGDHGRIPWVVCACRIAQN